MSEKRLPEFDPDDRVGDCPDPDATELKRIEVQFAVPVQMTQDEQRRLTLLIDEICRAPWNQPREGVHWMAEMGHKPRWSRADAALLGIVAEQGAPLVGEPTFESDVFCVASCARGFVSEGERDRTIRSRRRSDWKEEDRELFQKVVEALEQVAFMRAVKVDQTPPERLQELIEKVGRKCALVLVLLWEKKAKGGEE